MLNRVSRYFEDLDDLLAAPWSAVPAEPVTLFIRRDELSDLLAKNILTLMDHRRACSWPDDLREECGRMEAERRAFLNWVLEYPHEQLPIALLPCKVAVEEE